MNNQELKAKVETIVTGAEIAEGKNFLEVSVEPAKLYKLAKTLKESDDTAFDYLFNLTGVDWGDSLGVVYHLESTRHFHRIVLKTKTADREHPVVDTVSDLWFAAVCLEREAYDLLGIVFKNHPDLRRLFLDESWIGYPLRKDYTDDINIVER
jgi:NADH-quinone oxidoreductase subunit C